MKNKGFRFLYRVKAYNNCSLKLKLFESEKILIWFASNITILSIKYEKGFNAMILYAIYEKHSQIDASSYSDCRPISSTLAAILFFETINLKVTKLLTMKITCTTLDFSCSYLAWPIRLFFFFNHYLLSLPIFSTRFFYACHFRFIRVFNYPKWYYLGANSLSNRDSTLLNLGI